MNNTIHILDDRIKGHFFKNLKKGKILGSHNIWAVKLNQKWNYTVKLNKVYN